MGPGPFGRKRRMTRAPALFIGHGNPMNAIEDTPSSRGWADLAKRFERPRAIVVVSAHWTTDGVRVMANAKPQTIHDFGKSFPQALFDVQYPAPGDPALAQRIAELLAPFGAQLDESWGLDHGAWSVLVHMYPDAGVPVVQVSLDARRSPQEHYAIAQKLSALRDDNVLVLSSGNIVHNLRSFFLHQNDPAPPQDAVFEKFITDAAQANDDAAVLNYKNHPAAAVAAPDWDHFTPVVYALGARRDGEAPYIFNRDFAPGIAMTSIAYGLPA